MDSQMDALNGLGDDDVAAFIVVVCTIAATLSLSYFMKTYLMMAQPQERAAQRQSFINGIICRSDTECRNQLRMTRSAFFALRDKLVSSQRLFGTRGVSIDEQLVIFLHTIGHNVRNRPIRYYLGRSRETVSHHFNRVLNAIVDLYPEYVKIPRHDYTNHVPIRHHAYFEDCIGAIDGTHIPAMIPMRDQTRWRNRKRYISQNVMAVVGHDMRFHYVLAGWEGSATDAKVLQSALTRHDDTFTVPEGKYYVVDLGYANAPGFLAPYRSVRYHLSTFRASRLPHDYKELFNHRHSSLRNVVERVFGLLKGRFPILKTTPPYSIKSQVKLVIACCVLHNHILEFDRDVPFMDFNHDESDCMDPINEPFHNGANGLPTQEERMAWNAKRDALAALMWSDYCTPANHANRSL